MQFSKIKYHVTNVLILYLCVLCLTVCNQSATLATHMKESNNVVWLYFALKCRVTEFDTEIQTAIFAIKV